MCKVTNQINEELDVFVFNFDGKTIGIDDHATSKQLRRIAEIMDENTVEVSNA